MLSKKQIAYTCILLQLCLTSAVSRAQDFGQTIQIRTQFDSFVGRPSWLLIIRDIDHGQNIPYLYDVTRGDNFWLAFTYGRNYLILTSTLQFSPYRHWPYRTKKIENFCGLESCGHIFRGQSMLITIEGHLSPNTDTFCCNVTEYPDSDFIVVNPGKF